MARSEYWVEFQNNVWESVYKGRYTELSRLLDNTGLHLPLLAHPHQSEIIEECLRLCLQTLLYTTWLERSHQREIILADNLLVDVRESSHVVYWSVRHRSTQFLPEFSMTDLVIAQRHRGVVRYMLDILLQASSFQPVLRDGVCLLHLAVIAGHKLEKPDQSVDLFSNFLINSSGKVDYTCPWAGKTSLDFTLEYNLMFQSKQLYILGCRTFKMIEREAELSKEIVKVRIPSGDSGNAYEGMLKFNNILEDWRNNEFDFIDKLNKNIVGNDDFKKEKEIVIIETITAWLEKELDSKNNLPFPTKLQLSGSISEKSKIRPLDEIDYVLQCSLDIYLEVSDENVTKDWLHNSAIHYSAAEKELTKIDSKQPFPHLAQVKLQSDYPGLGLAGETLEPEEFSRVMKNFMWQTLTEKNLPDCIHVPEGKDFLEETRSGLFMNLEYLDNEAEQGLTIDLVSVITFSSKEYESVLAVMPRYDKNKARYITEKKLISCRDGIIVKNGDWRMSFSNSERKVISLHPHLYRALKYLNKLSEHHIDIPTYYLKEIFCSFIIHQGINNHPLQQPSLAISMAELITFSELQLIGSPFYCTKLGSHIEKSCLALFKRFKDKFAQEFEYFSFLRSSKASNNSGCKLGDCLAFPTVIWPVQPLAQTRI